VAAPALSPEEIRLKALKRFAISITALNIFGHTVLGFETSVLQVLVAVATTYSIELILQAIGDWSQGQRPAFLGNGFNGLVIFLLPAHITGFAISMLLFAHDELLPYVLASAAAICSKSIFTVSLRGKPRHFLNPSNIGLVASILIYPKIGLAAPYEFTEHLYGLLYIVLPCFILYTGSLLNGKLTKRMPLILSWVGAFIVQAVVRHFLFGTWLPASLAPITGVPFVIFTFYMVTDPATSPNGTRGQIVFGLSLGLIYGILMVLHQPFTLIVSLLILCVCRGAVLYAFEHSFAPKLRAFLDGAPAPGAAKAPAGVAQPAMPRSVPAVGAE
jgi:Na+-translocating ferredoxin:NAD+ oxidoreductase RnfD subunit